MVDLAAIRDAARQIEGAVARTPLIASPGLSEIAGAEIVLKLESLQPTGSFKVRGALVKLLSLDAAQRRAGVVAASAGNHAQGVAFHARRLGIAATIVMPKPTPFTKVARTEALGAQVVLAGDTLREAQAIARAKADAGGLAFVHPYDDERIIAGQGTVGLEILADAPDLDAVVVPVGGGGLIAGIATACKALRPGIEIVGAETAAYPSMRQAVWGGGPGEDGPTIADGIAVAEPGALTLPIVRALVADILLVSESAVEQAIEQFVGVQRLVVEGAGAAPLAAILGARERFAGRRVCLVVSGGNVDSRIVASILMRGLVREGRLVRLRIEIPDTPGALARVARLIGDAQGNILEVYHQRLFQDVPIRRADLDVVVETVDGAHARHVLERLAAEGFSARLLGSTAVGIE